ncbi:BTAD domain-containing putative transcriptional regulator [Kribbella albertanoniae]|uniref:AfsR/SARP family transcriptional regulator n=1 Tax=Kribbella albertanoniae TaxID=1266829 RepID=A0A4R4P6I2_9ACTN|nr:AfsR/SARP family transcriptional regulator [Kribbella albertanoniae]TDC16347.1 AfsR/SARP family transcriptional regulator [Kribbella albertanoniae]
MEFGVLGEVEARADGVAVELGTARQQVLLAVLLVEAGRSLPVDRLIERIWGDRPPKRAKESLYSYVSRLRTALGAAGGPTIERSSTGYALIADPSAVDLHRFRRAVAEARGTEEGRLPLLEYALSAWRGDAFAGLDNEWLSQVRATLKEERLAAELDRDDLRLEAGQQAAMVAELTQRVAEHPLNERLAGQLVLALHLSGRQADALAQYQLARQRLAAELGVEPGTALQRLHQQILVAATPPPERWRPAQLPINIAAFAGRADELAQLDKRLADGSVAVVSGMAGVGKTALAVQWAHQVADQFVDGQLYLNLRGFDPSGSPLTPEKALRALLEGLQISAERMPMGLDAQVKLYRSQLAGQRVLIVLDNARDAEQVRPLLPESETCFVVVTSRSRLTGLVAASPVRLDPLATRDAQTLLANRIGRDRVSADPEAAEAIVELCARLPLALAIVAARAAVQPGFPLIALANELAVGRDRLAAFDGEDAATDVRAMFSWSYEALDPATARMFRLLGDSPGPGVSAAAAAALAGVTSAAAQQLLGQLVEANLVQQPHPDRYEQHDLVRMYAIELAHTTDSAAERDAALRRQLSFYLHSAANGRAALGRAAPLMEIEAPFGGIVPLQFADDRQALDWLNTMCETTLAAVQLAAERGLDRIGFEVSHLLAMAFHYRGALADLLRVHELGLSCARRTQDVLAVAIAETDLGAVNSELGRSSATIIHLERAASLFEQISSPLGHAEALEALAIENHRCGRYAEAVQLYLRSIHLTRQSDGGQGEARLQNNVAAAYLKLSQYELAIAAARKALALCAGNRRVEAYAWDNLAVAQAETGLHNEAVDSYQRALTLCDELDLQVLKSSALGHLAKLQQVLGRPDEARAMCQEALRIHAGLEPDGTSEAKRGELIAILRSLGQQ